MRKQAEITDSVVVCAIWRYLEIWAEKCWQSYLRSWPEEFFEEYGKEFVLGWPELKEVWQK